MTEVEWLACVDPDLMLWTISGHPDSRKLWVGRNKPTARKWRLLGVACCHRVWSLITEVECRRVVEVVEAYADGEVAESELRSVADAAVDCGYRVHHDRLRHRAYAATDALGRGVGLNATLEHSCSCVVRHTAWAAGGERSAEMRVQAGFIRDIFGNPFRPVTLNPAWLTPTLVALSTGIYEEKAFDRMPILADALQDADCLNEDILNHCRQPGEHTRGCWAIDSLLNKV
jgi:hypothetical protein